MGPARRRQDRYGRWRYLGPDGVWYFSSDDAPVRAGASLLRRPWSWMALVTVLVVASVAILEHPGARRSSFAAAHRAEPDIRPAPPAASPTVTVPLVTAPSPVEGAPSERPAIELVTPLDLTGSAGPSVRTVAQLPGRPVLPRIAASPPAAAEDSRAARAPAPGPAGTHTAMPGLGHGSVVNAQSLLAARSALRGPAPTIGGGTGAGGVPTPTGGSGSLPNPRGDGPPTGAVGHAPPTAASGTAPPTPASVPAPRAHVAALAPAAGPLVQNPVPPIARAGGGGPSGGCSCRPHIGTGDPS